MRCFRDVQQHRVSTDKRIAPFTDSHSASQTLGSAVCGDRPGDILQVEIVRLGRIAGITYLKAGNRQVKRHEPGGGDLHVCVDNPSRLAFTAINTDRTEESAPESPPYAVSQDKRDKNTVKRNITGSLVRLDPDSVSNTKGHGWSIRRRMKKQCCLSDLIEKMRICSHIFSRIEVNSGSVSVDVAVQIPASVRSRDRKLLLAD